jgi:two-component system, LytTR family, sensor kinase
MYKTLRKNLVSILILIFLGNLIAFFMDPSFTMSPKMWLLNSLFSIGLGWPMMKLNELVILRFGKKIRWDLHPVKRIAATLGVVIVVSILLTFLINYVFVLRIKGASFPEFIKTTLNLLLIEILLVIYIFSVVTGIEFFKLWRQGLVRQELLQRKALELQLEALKNQVNPHFLFNSLNTLTTLVHKDPDMALQLIMHLSDSYRYLLEQKDKKLVLWSVERQFVENYLGLQQMRFADNLRIEIKAEERDDFFVVPLSVQMMVENAIKHNIITSDEPLQISLYTEGAYLVVRNNLQVKTTLVSGENVGLENIRQQYEILSGRKVEVLKDDGYFTVKLPMIVKSLTDL